MKKIFLLAFLVFACPAFSRSDVREMIVFSQQKCIHCKEMLRFIDDQIRPAYPALNIVVHDIAEEDNMKLLRRYIRDYKLNPKLVGTPIAFIGTSHFIGWSPDNEDRLIAAINAYLSDSVEK